MEGVGSGGGGGAAVEFGLGVQGGCVHRIEVFEKKSQKKNGGGGSGGVRAEGSGGM